MLSCFLILWIGLGLGLQATSVNGKEINDKFHRNENRNWTPSHPTLVCGYLYILEYEISHRLEREMNGIRAKHLAVCQRGYWVLRSCSFKACCP